MKFIVFNIVVAVALIYLVADKDNRIDVQLPNLGEVTAAAGQVLDRTPAGIVPTETDAPAPKTANPFSLVSQPEAVAPTPAPVVDAPVIDDADIAISNAGTAFVDAPVIAAADIAISNADSAFVDAPVIDKADIAISNAATTVAVAAKPLDPVLARRRAEVLGVGPGTPPEPVRPVADRRRQLLDLAEEMEYLAAEFSVQ